MADEDRTPEQLHIVAGEIRLRHDVEKAMLEAEVARLAEIAAAWKAYAQALSSTRYGRLAKSDEARATLCKLGVDPDAT